MNKKDREAMRAAFREKCDSATKEDFTYSLFHDDGMFKLEKPKQVIEDLKLCYFAGEIPDLSYMKELAEKYNYSMSYISKLNLEFRKHYYGIDGFKNELKNEMTTKLGYYIHKCDELLEQGDTKMIEYARRMIGDLCKMYGLNEPTKTETTVTKKSIEFKLGGDITPESYEEINNKELPSEDKNDVFDLDE